MRRKKHPQIGTDLINKCSLKVRFSEVDSLKIVWHGEYVKYFEDGREAFGSNFPGLGYMDIYKSGFSTPIVDIHVSYKLPLIYGDSAIVETKYIYSPAAKIMFEYRIFRESDGALVAEGSSIQVFLDDKGDLVLVNPDFYLKWQERWIVLE